MGRPKKAEELAQDLAANPKSIRNISDEVWRRVKMKCVCKGLKLYEGVNEALEEWAKDTDTDTRPKRGSR